MFKARKKFVLVIRSKPEAGEEIALFLADEFSMVSQHHHHQNSAEVHPVEELIELS